MVAQKTSAAKAARQRFSFVKNGRWQILDRTLRLVLCSRFAAMEPPPTREPAYRTGTSFRFHRQTNQLNDVSVQVFPLADCRRRRGAIFLLRRYINRRRVERDPVDRGADLLAR